MQQDVQTSSPIKNTIKLYQKCKKELIEVESLYKEFRYMDADEKLDKVEMIFYELKMQLNEDAGSEALIMEFVDLYEWSLDEVYKIKQFRNSEGVSGVVVVLDDLIEAFKGVMLQNDENQIG